ncbi:MAG: hypothetical protein AAEJ52_10345 [Myxococcota bacterium]
MMWIRVIGWATRALALTSVFVPSLVWAVTFVNLANTNLGACLSATASGISSDGSTVVGICDGHAFRWTLAEGAVYLSELAGGFTQSSATAASSDGSVIVGWGKTIDARERVFKWTQVGGMVEIGTPPSPTQSYRPTAVSGDGTVIIAESRSSGSGFYYTDAGGAVELGGLPGQGIQSKPYALSLDGTIVAGVTPRSPGSSVAFSWTVAGGMVDLGRVDPLHDHSIIRGISADGSTLVGESKKLTNPFLGNMVRWTASGGMEAIECSPGVACGGIGLAASGDGSLIGGSDSEPLQSFDTARIWDPVNGGRDLEDALVADGADLDGVTVETVNAISADGKTLTGHGKFLLIIPELGGIHLDTGWVAIYEDDPVEVPSVGPIGLVALALAFTVSTACVRARNPASR